jgi:hypothetical protein
MTQENTILVSVNYSTEGHYTESFRVGYDPRNGLALFLMMNCFEQSTFVTSYSVYDANGKRDGEFDEHEYPKRQ